LRTERFIDQPVTLKQVGAAYEVRVLDEPFSTVEDVAEVGVPLYRDEETGRAWRAATAFRDGFSSEARNHSWRLATIRARSPRFRAIPIGWD
jgi:hypothetical protein